MLGRLLLAALLASLAIGVVIHGLSTTPRPALACSGSVDVEQGAAYASVIVLADAIEVGDGVNRAPTPGPSSPPRAAASPAAHPTPEHFSLAGIGATLSIVQAYTTDVDISQPLSVDQGQRTGIERELREREAGGGLYTTCGLGEFTFRFEQGVRYLVFARDFGNGSGLITISRLPIDGNDVVLVDPSAPFGSSPLAYPTASLYHRFFEGVLAEVDDARGFAHISAERVPLSAVLRAVAYIRGDASIAPPDTGSAGLASGRS